MKYAAQKPQLNEAMVRKKQKNNLGDLGPNEQPESQRTVVRHSRERKPDWGGEHDAEAGAPFYRLDPSTQQFESLARVAPKVESIKNCYLGPAVPPQEAGAKVPEDNNFNEGSQSASSPDDAVPLDQGMREIAQMIGYGEIYAAHESENERFDWISRDPLMRDIARMIATGDWKGLRIITNIVGSYETKYDKPLGGQAIATVWTMIACDLLWEHGLNRNQITKAEIRTQAERLWAGAMCHRKRLPSTRENIEKEKSNLPTIRWQRVWEGLGLRDIKDAPAGRPPKNR